jgi:hypothetical protein
VRQSRHVEKPGGRRPIRDQDPRTIQEREPNPIIHLPASRSGKRRFLRCRNWEAVKENRRVRERLLRVGWVATRFAFVRSAGEARTHSTRRGGAGRSSKREGVPILCWRL